MKKTAREIALDILVKVNKDKSYSNIQLNKTLEKAELSRADINLVTEIIYGTIQHLTKIDWILGNFLRKEIEPWVMNLLRLSVYQILFLDRIPERAVVHEAVDIAKRKGHEGIGKFVNGVLRNLLRQKESLKVPEHVSKQKKIEIEYSHPAWLVNLLINDYGADEAEEICKVNNISPYHSLRVNPLKISRDEMLGILKEELEEAVVEASPLSHQGIRIKGGGNLAYSKWFRDGYISIQDESSMLVADVLDPRPNMVVLDALAAPGGKTTHIAEKMNDQGRIIATDIHKHKVKLIMEQQKRLGLHIIEAVNLDARKIREQYGQIFDRILLDVPCSGLGVIRRKPELKWTKTEKAIEDLTIIQQEILDSVSALLKPDGVLVYSTCTITKRENQMMMEHFVDRNPNFKLDVSLSSYLPEKVNEKIDTSKGMLQLLPHHFQTDGFFISRLNHT